MVHCISKPMNNSTQRLDLTTVVLHENEAATQRADLILDILRSMFCDEAAWPVKRWSFHQLERLDVRAMASHHGKDAAILMLCTSSDQKVPDNVLTWMERTYQQTDCLKPVILRVRPAADSEEAFIRKLASTWKVPLASDFSLDSFASWKPLREFIEQRLNYGIHNSQNEAPEGHDSGPNIVRHTAPREAAPLDQKIRDHAYQLWISAGRPDGHQLDFWHQAERELRQDRVTSKASEQYHHIQPNPTSNETNPHSSGHHSRRLSQLMLKLSSHFHARPRNALLQHLARAS